jgi:hypothetical protein
LSVYVHLLPDDLADADYQDDLIRVPDAGTSSEAGTTVAAVADLAEAGATMGQPHRPMQAETTIYAKLLTTGLICRENAKQTDASLRTTFNPN